MDSRIVWDCRVLGHYIVSQGTMNPAIVLSRLLDTVLELEPAVHGRLTAPGGPYCRIPEAALRHEMHPWWSTEDATSVVLELFGAMNRSLPTGFACVLEANHQLVIRPFDDVASSCAAASMRPEASAAWNPAMSAVRRRVG